MFESGTETNTHVNKSIHKGYGTLVTTKTQMDVFKQQLIAQRASYIAMVLSSVVIQGSILH